MISSILGKEWTTFFYPTSDNTTNTNTTPTNPTNTNTNNNTNKVYYLMPQQIIPTKIPYLNVNTNYELRDSVTSFFLNKTIKWIKNKELSDNYKSVLLSHKGNEFIYGLLRKYVNKHGFNWYDLREKHYHSVKEYLIRKLSKQIK